MSESTKAFSLKDINVFIARVSLMNALIVVALCDHHISGGARDPCNNVIYNLYFKTIHVNK